MNELILYTSEDGKTRLDLRVEGETIWLTQLEMAELFQRSKKTISEHIGNIFSENELQESSVVRNFRTTATDGKSYDVAHYNLEAILAVGFRVKSPRGTQFRQWANTQLKEYLVKGFVMNDERLKNPGGWDYFDELLERIRDIRSSERRFYQKVLDIYATSVDYTPDAAHSQRFFSMVQNKMHWATHGQTAAEVIADRSNADQPFMGLQTTRTPGVVRKDDVGVAKNYLTEDELQVLNRIVNLYIEYAELQALGRKAMTMEDWITKLDEFLKISGRDLLDHAGKISAADAKAKAEYEYDRYRKIRDAQPQRIDADFEKATSELKKLPKSKTTKPPKK